MLQLGHPLVSEEVMFPPWGRLRSWLRPLLWAGLALWLLAVGSNVLDAARGPAPRYQIQVQGRADWPATSPAPLLLTRDMSLHISAQPETRAVDPVTVRAFLEGDHGAEPLALDLHRGEGGGFWFALRGADLPGGAAVTVRLVIDRPGLLFPGRSPPQLLRIPLQVLL